MAKDPADNSPEEAPKRPIPPKPHAHMNANGKANRADQHKGKQHKPTKQRMQRHQGR